MRTGRTSNLILRSQQHARDPILKQYNFVIDIRTDNYAVQRGREQLIHELYNPPLNYINPIRANNPNRNDYLNAARKYLEQIQAK